MKAGLLKTVPQEQQDELRRDFEASTVTRRALVAYLGDKIDQARVAGSKKSSYDTPNWAYMQADLVGYERALREIINILK